MSNVIDPPDSPTEPVVKATIIPYKKNGVVICTTSLKEATNATAEAKDKCQLERMYLLHN